MVGAGRLFRGLKAGAETEGKDAKGLGAGLAGVARVGAFGLPWGDRP